ncbi:hypothetical protein COO91_00419 [Nostoc flagelliforme CCNUN1]|uniref:Uncharacterized protein n=1 Tax=Nostoc flagelliforme CCNUN1 TaxID=2038116 RepID=A0A2K8SGV4_9NOSO|nr:hypothetical protein COO91_00419 [Nostoc flagelliforme CCNUN1]
MFIPVFISSYSQISQLFFSKLLLIYYCEVYERKFIKKAN